MELKPIAIGGLKGAYRLLNKDLAALPEEAFDQSFGPKTRTVADIVHELNLMHDHVGLTIRKEPLFDWPEGWIKAPADAKTKEAVIAAFERSSSQMLETIDNLSEEELLEKFSNEHGETDAFEQCRFMASHIWYHSGQINYIQTLRGDDVWHWMS